MGLNEIYHQYPWFFPFLAIVFLLIAGRFIRNRFKGVPISRGSHPAKVQKAIGDILEKELPFYGHLSGEGKKKFILRVAGFIASRRFIGMENLQVTFEMKVRIAATAVKLTFGLDKTGMKHYRVIRIFPETFYSRMHDRYLKGGASTGGTLMFSWKDFEEGYRDPADRYNLGLHEMAHALRIELKYGSDFDSRFADYTDHWEHLALPEFEKMNQGKTSFLRDYGGTNMEEFFAVCVEHFFEVPEEFKKQLPDIYNHLSYLLNLDPLRIDSDYVLEPGFIQKINANPSLMPLPEKVNKAYQYYDWHWSYSAILTGLFAGVFVILYLYGKVLFNLSFLMAVLIPVAALLFIFRNWFFRNGILGIPHLSLFTLAGAFPLVSALILLLNYNFTSGVEVTAFRVTGFKTVLEDSGGIRSKHLLLNLENNALQGYRKVRTFPLTDFDGAGSLEEVRVIYTFTSGFFGLKNLENRQILIVNRGSEAFF